MTCPTRRAARSLAGTQREPVWRYFYTHTWSRGSQVPARAGHQTQLGFSWHNLDQAGFTPTDAERRLADAFLGYWTPFAASGDPNGAGAPRWPRYDPATDSYLGLDERIVAGMNLRVDACDLWDDIPLPAAGADARSGR